LHGRAAAQIEHTGACGTELRGKLGAGIYFLFRRRRWDGIRRQFQSQIAIDVQIHGHLCRGRYAGPSTCRRITFI